MQMLLLKKWNINVISKYSALIYCKIVNCYMRRTRDHLIFWFQWTDSNARNCVPTTIPTVIIQYLSNQSALIIRIQDFTHLDPDLFF